VHSLGENNALGVNFEGTGGEQVTSGKKLAMRHTTASNFETPEAAVVIFQGLVTREKAWYRASTALKEVRRRVRSALLWGKFARNLF